MSELYRKDLLIILQIVTNMLRMLGFILIIPAVVSFFLKDPSSSELFFFMSVVLIVVFTVVKRFLRIQECRMKHAIISLAIGWISISLISSIPFIVHHMGFIDSFFEAFSGWTGTGLTMVRDPAMLPASMNFYRGFIQWVGGFGIVVLALLIYQKPKTAQSLFLAEGRFEDFYIDFSKIARTIVIIYSIYTIIGIGLFWLVGVPIFDAVVHTMTTISTGGFSSNSVGIGLYGKLPMLIAIVFMYIGGISFLTHYHIIKGKIVKLLGNPEVRFMFLMTFAAVIVIFFDLLKARKAGYFSGLFYSVSALTGTGAGTTLPVASFPTASLTIIILLMICGATYGSTTGAIKIWRVMIVLKNVKREIIKPFYPSGTILPIKMGSHIISDEDSLKATVYVILYLVILAAGSLLFVLAGYRLFDSVFLVSSAQGNVGLNIVTENYFNMNPLLKLQLIFHMLLGRVEIIPFIAMLRSIVAFRR